MYMLKLGSSQTMKGNYIFCLHTLSVNRTTCIIYIISIDMCNMFAGFGCEPTIGLAYDNCELSSFKNSQFHS